MVATAIFLRKMSDYIEIANMLKPYSIFMRPLIYIAIIIYAGYYFRVRVSSKSVSLYLSLISDFLLIWFILRTCKYHLLCGIPTLERYCWYLYYLPMLLIPQMLLYAALNLGKGDFYKIRLPFKLSGFFTVMLLLVVLINDLHQTVFMFAGEDSMLAEEYEYGFMYFIILSWIALLIFLFLFFLIKNSYYMSKKRVIIKLMFLLSIGIIYVALYILKVELLFVIAGDMTEVFTLITLATCYICIESGLIPSNRNHEELFVHSTVRALITDEEYSKKLVSENAIDVQKEDIIKSVVTPTDKGNYRISATKIRGGYMVWMESIVELKAAIKELKEKQEEIDRANEILIKDTKLTEERIKTREKIEKYNLIFRKTETTIKEMEEIISEKLTDDSNLEQELSKLCLLGTYVKRCGNMILEGENKGILNSKELEYAIRESMDTLMLSGIECVFLSNSYDCKNVNTLISAYDFFTSAIITILKEISKVTCSVCVNDDVIVITIKLKPKEGCELCYDSFRDRKDLDIDFNNDEKVVTIKYTVSGGAENCEEVKE